MKADINIKNHEKVVQNEENSHPSMYAGMGGSCIQGVPPPKNDKFKKMDLPKNTKATH